MRPPKVPPTKIKTFNFAFLSRLRHQPGNRIIDVLSEAGISRRSWGILFVPEDR